MDPLNDKTARPIARVFSLIIAGCFILAVLSYDVTVYTKKSHITYSTVNKKTNSLELAQTKVKRKGSPGIRTITYQKRSIFGITLSNNEMKSEVTEKPKSAIVLIGTKEIAVPQIEPMPVAPQPSCDGNYSGGCVPVVNYDLDCSDIGFTVYVVGVDNHWFDGDGDGVGCEWN